MRERARGNGCDSSHRTEKGGPHAGEQVSRDLRAEEAALVRIWGREPMTEEQRGQTFRREGAPQGQGLGESGRSRCPAEQRS